MHTLLARQIRRHLAGLDLESGPLRSFLAAVDRSYAEADDGRQLLELAMDISSEELLEANATLRGLLDVFPDLVLRLHADGRILARLGNKLGAGRLVESDIVGRPLQDLVAPESTRALAGAIASAVGTNGVRTVVCPAAGSARSVWHEYRIAAAGTGELLAVVRDVTDIRRSEQLRLEKEGAEAASQAKSTFLANMSHELRTPLNAILGYCQLLLEDARDRGDTVLSEDLQRIDNAGRHLNGLISDVLDITKIEAGAARLEVTSFDVADVIRGVMDTARILAEQRHNRLEVSGLSNLGFVRSDETKVRQILLNLIGNACKFTTNGSVRVECRRDTTGHDERLSVAVIDSGIGIDAERIERMFEPFSQADPSTTRRFGGSGLGLAISRCLAELLGGCLTARSQPGCGSTFTLTMPVVAPGGRTASDPTTPVDRPVRPSVGIAAL